MPKFSREKMRLLYQSAKVYLAAITSYVIIETGEIK